MTDRSKKPVAAKPAAAPKPPKKLVPRTAATPAPDVAAVAETAPPPAPATIAAAVKARPARKPTQVQETVARHQKELADALAKAQAIKYDQPKVMKPVPPAAKKAKPEKVEKPRKPKLVRDSYAMPEAEYARIGELKKRLGGLGHEVKKSELLRGGIALLAALDDGQLKAAMARIERIKTGRPTKK